MTIVCGTDFSDAAARLVGREADQIRADPLGRSGVSRVVVGTVAEAVMRLGRRPVLVLRPPAG